MTPLLCELVSRPDADAVRVRTPSVRAARWRRRGEAADAGADYRDVNLCHVRAPTAAIRESTRTARRCGPAAADESSARDWPAAARRCLDRRGRRRILDRTAAAPIRETASEYHPVPRLPPPARADSRQSCAPPSACAGGRYLAVRRTRSRSIRCRFADRR